MKIIFVSTINDDIYSGYEDAKCLARKFSGCDVICLDSSHGGSRDKEFVTVTDKRSAKINKLAFCGLRRFWIAMDFIEKEKLNPPFIFPDWDYMIFQNLTLAFDPFMQYDWATSIHKDGNMLAAHFVTNMDALHEFFRLTMELAQSVPDKNLIDGFHDMAIWKMIYESHVFKAGNTMEVHNGSTFDCGMHLPNAGTPAYKADSDGYKTLSWKDGRPYFETVDGQAVKANWIHCWGKYKTKTQDLLSRAKP
jgi:hypothetical protein